MDEYLVVSEEELRDADALLAGVPDMEIHPPETVIRGHRGKLLENESPPWIKLSVEFRKHWLKALKGSMLPIFLDICLHIDKDGQCFPGIETIADETGYSTRQVIRTIQELEGLGLLETRRTFIDRVHRRNFYTVKALAAYGYSNPKGDILSPLNVTDKDEKNEKMSHEVEPLRRTTKKNQTAPTVQPSVHAKEESTMTTIEEHKNRTEEALRASMMRANTGYAHTYPEDVRPIVERMETLWYLRAPTRPKKKGGQYGFWIESSRELLDACGEFGAEMLDDLRKDWDQYNRENGGLAPHTVSSPKSLINTAASKASLLRQGNKNSLWQSKPKAGQTAHQSTLDV